MVNWFAYAFPWEYINAMFEQDLNLSELEIWCGVGVVVTPGQVEEAVEAELAKVKEEIRDDEESSQVKSLTQFSPIVIIVSTREGLLTAWHKHDPALLYVV